MVEEQREHLRWQPLACRRANHRGLTQRQHTETWMDARQTSAVGDKLTSGFVFIKQLKSNLYESLSSKQIFNVNTLA